MSRARRSRTTGVAFGLAGALASGLCAAQSEPRFAIDRFEPAERGSEWFANESLDLRGALRPSLGVVSAVSYRSFVVRNDDGSVRRSPVRNLAVAHAGGSLVVGERVRLAFDLPLQVFADGHSAIASGRYFPGPPNEQGVADLRLGADVRVLGEHRAAITGAVGLQVWAPTGQPSQWAGDGGWRVRPRAMVAGEVGVFVYAAQLSLGYRERSESLGPNSGAIGSDAGFAASGGARLGERLVVGPEVFGSTVLSDAFGKRSTPVEALLGAHYAIADIVRVGAGIGGGLTSGIGSPARRVFLSVEWAPAPPKPGGRRDVSTTPDAVADRDRDGIPDQEDACPEARGPRTSDPQTNGCPPDRDRDRVPDELDACPAVAGIGTNDPRTNGCPPDTDGDDIDDLADACPTTAGLHTSDPKTNGCPDPDRDKDTVPNDVDACPDEPGPADADPTRSGCPKAFVKGGQIRILEQVSFRTGSAEILASSVLDVVTKVLADHPEIKKVRIEGHTDNRGALGANRKLSGDRAAAVVRWLVGHGIESARLSSEGFGSDRPIDTNETEAGRASNRRVELHIE